MKHRFLLGILIGTLSFGGRIAAQSDPSGTTGVNAFGYEVPYAQTPELLKAIDKGTLAIRDKWFASERIKRGVDANGTAIIECRIERDGTIGDVQLVLSSGDTSLDEDALSSVVGAVFKELPGNFKATQLRFVFFFNLPSTKDRPACDALKLGPFKKAGGAVTPPQVLEQGTPDYSEEARRVRYQGSLQLGLTVNTEGAPGDICVEQGLGMGLDERAIASVSNWKFEAGRENGVPVPVRIKVEVSFALY